MAHLTAAQAAARLGVKRETLYAYVSRGLLTRQVEGKGRHSTFDPDDVERLARRGRLAPPAEHAEIRVRSSVTVLGPGGPSYRGVAAADLAGTHPFEAVAELLWTGALPDAPPPWSGNPALLAAGRAVLAALASPPRFVERIRLLVDTAAAVDTSRVNLAPEAVIATTRSLVAVVVDGLLPADEVTASRRATAEDSIAARLARSLSAEAPPPGLVETLDAALVLVADHDLAVSTLAARLAASVRADPYAIVTTGFAVLGGVPHRRTGPTLEAMLDRVTAGQDSGMVIEQQLRRDGTLAGFGHPLYPNGDPRAAQILELLNRADVPRDRQASVSTLADVALWRKGQAPTVGFAVAALAHMGGMASGASEAIIAIARIAGWMAHALEEYARPTTFRPVAVAADRR